MTERHEQYQARGGGNGCARCAELEERLARIAGLCAAVVTVPQRRGRRRREFCEVGVLIAAATSSLKNDAGGPMTLADLSKSIGRAPDYAARICRGDLHLTPHSAIVLGGKLGLDLLRFVPKGEPAPPPNTGGHAEPQALGSTPLPAPKPLPFAAGAAFEREVEP